MVDALNMLVERGSLRGTTRVTGHKKDTIASRQERAGEHADALREYLLYKLHLDRVEVNELYTCTTTSACLTAAYRWLASPPAISPPSITK